jgi:hypothetical protein
MAVFLKVDKLVLYAWHMQSVVIQQNLADSHIPLIFWHILPVLFPLLSWQRHKHLNLCLPINNDPLLFSHKCIFIVNNNCQSGLRALAEGPLHDYGYSCSNLNWSSMHKTYLDTATTYGCHFHLNTFLPMLVLNQMKPLIILPNIMQVHFHQRNNIVQILNYLH